jgi:cell division protein ZapA
VDTPSKTIRVSIFGDEYPLRAEGDADTEYMTRVADHVDRAMRKIADRSPSLPAAKVAILAALNITDEMFSSLRESDRKSGGLQARAQVLREKLEARLAAGSGTHTAPTDSPSRLSLSAN